MLEDHGDAGADYLDCTSLAYSNAASCLAANMDCETGQVDTCEQARATALAACTQVPELDRQTFDACI